MWFVWLSAGIFWAELAGLVFCYFKGVQPRDNELEAGLQKFHNPPPLCASGPYASPQEHEARFQRIRTDLP